MLVYKNINGITGREMLPLMSVVVKSLVGKAGAVLKQKLAG
jgi:hypothetical protein